MASLRALWKKTPNSAYIPFLLGNLYYDQRWWTVAMEHYTARDQEERQYRTTPTLNRNVISMLASDKTSRKAQGFSSTPWVSRVPYLDTPSQHDANGSGPQSAPDGSPATCERAPRRGASGQARVPHGFREAP
jgi:hypothetical protein